MSDSASPRQKKNATTGAREPMFEARQAPLPTAPQPMSKIAPSLEDLPEFGPRTRRPQTLVAPPVARRPRIIDRELESPPPSLRSQMAEATADLHRAQIAGGYSHAPRLAFAPAPASRRSVAGLFHDYPWLFAIVAAVCIAIIALASAPQRTIISPFSQSSAGEISAESAPEQNVPPGQHSVLGQPTLSAEQIDAVLGQFHSPAAGSGQIWIEMGKRYGINPAYALAFFIHESTAGTAPGWAGLKPDGGTTHNIGNIICAGYATCFGRFRDYPNWDAGIEDWYKLIAHEYVEGRGARTLEEIIPIYAPASDNNDVGNYVQVVVNLVEGWKHPGASQ